MGAVTSEGPAVRSDRARLVPWALWVLSVAISVATLVLVAPHSTLPRNLADYLNYAIGLLWGATAGLIGALITSNRRDVRIGWLMVAIGLVVSYMVLAATASETDHPAADALNILSDAGWVIFIAAFSVLIGLFPDGRPLTPRWRPVIWFVGLWPFVFLLLALIFAPQDLLAEDGPILPEIAMAVLLLVSFAAMGVSAVLRFRRSAGTERQQLKWFAYGTAIGLAFTIIATPLPVWGGVIAGLGLFGPLAGIAVALFRYRLYDIDELISRTFVYGALLAILAGVYTASIRFFNLVFSGVTGIGSEEALVITTLILATTFTPIKKRLEALVEARYKTPEDEPAAPSGDRSGAAIGTADEARLRAIVREELERAAQSRLERT